MADLLNGITSRRTMGLISGVVALEVAVDRSAFFNQYTENCCTTFGLHYCCTLRPFGRNHDLTLCVLNPAL